MDNNFVAYNKCFSKMSNYKTNYYLKAGVLLLAVLVLCCLEVTAINLKTAEGSLESISVKWEHVNGAVTYDVTYDTEGQSTQTVNPYLIRQYPDYIRVDIPGLKAGDYIITIRALDENGNELDKVSTSSITVIPHTREGFAFTGGNVPGAYNIDGTLKEGARILYVTKTNVNTIVCSVADNKGKLAEYTGLSNILNAYGKGYDKTPLLIRIIGTIKAEEFTGLKDNNYINLQGSNNTTRLLENVTIEGIGDDATLYGYGVCFKRAHNIELSNLAIMLFGDDAVSMDTDNTNIWIHNIDFFYGAPGKDADQVKGDGSIDMKYHSTDITISFNHFWDSGKVMGCGGATGETENLRISFHHNWFDHADSRCPRLHYTTAHIYNNYYDGVSVYGIGNTTETSAFVEGNYFRNVSRPMMISGQGTDKYDESTGTYTLKGTFSGQDGGMTKAYNNIFADNEPKLVYQTQHETQFDAYLTSTREEQIPASVVSVTGGWAYSNFDTASEMYVSNPDNPKDVPTRVVAYAGRIGGGDFKWIFDNGVDDKDHEVNTGLKAAIVDYSSQLIQIQGEGNILPTGITKPMAQERVGYRVYSIDGYEVTNRNFSMLPSGLYIINNGQTVKKVVKR